jgi:hypothetical protein
MSDTHRLSGHAEITPHLKDNRTRHDIHEAEEINCTGRENTSSPYTGSLPVVVPVPRLRAAGEACQPTQQRTTAEPAARHLPTGVRLVQLARSVAFGS